MQDRVIENWLTDANELSFTVPYSQVLVLQGHRILQISPKKATLEQGKDITTVDKDGVVHCYQLKGGDVTLDRWRKELKPEVKAMADLPPQHPSLKKVADWECHLVLNGEFRGEATREVVDTQRAREQSGRRSFDVIGRGALLRAFSDVYGKYLPKELDDFTAFIDLYREDGLEPINKPAMSKVMETFFGSAFSSEPKPPTKNAIRQQINAAIVSTSYLLANKYRQQNHIAVLEGGLLLLGYIFAAVEKNGLDERYWRTAVKLIEQILDETVDELLNELQQRTHYAQPATVPFADAYVYKTRVTLVAGYLAAYCTYRRLGGRVSPAEARVNTFLEKAVELELITIMGEGQIPLLANIALFHRLAGGTDRAELLVACVGLVLEARDKGNLFDPYTDIQDILRSALEITLTPTHPNSGGNSYALLPLIFLLAYFGSRDVLTAWWPFITEISTHEFKPAQPWQWFFWNCAHGKQEARFPQQTQSWAELVALARKPDTAVMSKVMRERPYYLPLFFCLMPHRMSGYAMRTLVAALPTS